MPGIDGLETLRRIMAQFPRPVIMVSASTLKDAETTFIALAAGAFDYVPSNSPPHPWTSLTSAMINRQNQGSRGVAPLEGHLFLERNLLARWIFPSRKASHSPPAIIALGIFDGRPKGAGGDSPALPIDLPVPILVVQHMPVGFTAPFAQRLNNLVRFRYAKHRRGDGSAGGCLHCSAGSHMTVDRPSISQVMIWLSDKPEKQLHVPSVDVMMQSVAFAFIRRRWGSL